MNHTAAIASWLMSQGQNKCPKCDKVYDIGSISGLVPLRSGKLDLDGQITAVVPITCESCGDVRFLSPKVIKLAF